MRHDQASPIDITPAAVNAFVVKSMLRDLVYRYARAVDRRDKQLLLSCYHPDAIDDHGTYFKGDAISFAEWLTVGMDQFAVSAHYIMNCDFRVDGNTAEGEIYFIGYHRSHGDCAREGMMGGRYLDGYEYRSEAWRIIQRVVVWDFLADHLVDPVKLAALRGLGPSGSGKDDPSFDVLPSHSQP